MGLMDGKKGLIFGVANDHSIAWGIASALHREGATLGFNFVGEALERRVRPLAESLGAPLIAPCDVTDDEQIAAFFEQARAAFGTIDFVVHAVAYALREEIAGKFLDTSREGFRIALDVSAYSLTALTRAAKPMLNPNAAILTLTYHGAQQVIPHYNVMGVAKAALEASVRYLAADLGPEGIRVNAISAGPIRTLAASGISGFRDMQRKFGDLAPLRRNVTTADVGNAALWLLSDLSGGVTGDIVYVDAGAHILGLVPSE
jgi:enoyl-[acyl-carrier protein] reductase I